MAVLENELGVGVATPDQPTLQPRLEHPVLPNPEDAQQLAEDERKLREILQPVEGHVEPEDVTHERKKVLAAISGSIDKISPDEIGDGEITKNSAIHKRVADHFKNVAGQALTWLKENFLRNKKMEENREDSKL